MKSIFTATGYDALNSIFKKEEERGRVHVIDIDIQRQETLWEKLALDDFKNADALVIVEMLPGPFSKNELIHEARKQFNGEIFVLLEEDHDDQFISYLRDLKITQIFSVDEDPKEFRDKVIYEAHTEEVEETESVVKPIDASKSEIEKVYIQKKAVAIIGPGGLGKTTVTLELADRLRQEKYSVCVLDLNLEKADIAGIEGVEEKGIQRILKEEQYQQAVLENVTTKKNVHYFTGLTDLMEINEVNKIIKGVIKVLKKHYDVVLMDTGNFANEVTHEAIRESDHQVFLLNPAERTIKAVKKYLDLYKNLDMPMKAVSIMNFYTETSFSLKDVEEIIGIKIIGKIKYDKKTFSSIEKGNGFNKSKDKSVISELKEELFPSQKRRGLFGRGR